MASADRPVSLRKVLDSNFLAHRKDVHDFAGGHLNPDKLQKFETFERHTSWESASSKKEDASHLIAQTRKQADRLLVDKIEHMQNTLADFSVGTSGTLSGPRPTMRRKKRTALSKTKTDFHAFLGSTPHPQSSETDLESEVLSGISKLLDKQEGRTVPPRLSDGARIQSNVSSVKQVPRHFHGYRRVLIEEMKLPEVMLPSVKDDARVPASMKDDFLTPKQRVNQITDKNFMTMHFAGITQRDRFNKMLDFDRNVLHRYETMEKRARDGHKAAEHLEHKLVIRLLELKEHAQHPYSVNFERLQVYDEVWRDLCVDSMIFGNLLLEIKNQYDSRLSTLLDMVKSTSHSEILTCLDASEGISEFTESDVEKRKSAVHCLEEDGRKTLLRNYELHQEIEREKEQTEEKKKQKEKEDKENRLLLPLKYFGKKRANENEKPVKKESNTKKRLQILRVKIWEKLDEINKVRDDLRANYVPKTLHKNMLQAVQDTEGEMQKLLQQREYISKNTFLQLESLQYDLSRFDSMNSEEAENFLSSLGS